MSKKEKIRFIIFDTLAKLCFEIGFVAFWALVAYIGIMGK